MMANVCEDANGHPSSNRPPATNLFSCRCGSYPIPMCAECYKRNMERETRMDGKVYCHDCYPNCEREKS